MRTTSAATKSRGRRRKADGGFTLLELLVIIGVLGITAAISVASIQRGRDVARMKGSVRDVFATVRIARSSALVTQQPCVMSFRTAKNADGEWCGSVSIDAANMLKPSGITRARTIGGEWRSLSEEPESADESVGGTQGGETLEEILFEPVSEEVFKGICIKVLLENEELDPAYGEVDEAKRSMISTFSNVDYLLGKYREAKKKEADKEKAEGEANAAGGETAAQAASGGGDAAEDKSVVWQTNGRCDPHTIYVYADGTDPATDGWRIEVDRFGAAKIHAPGESDL